MKSKILLLLMLSLVGCSNKPQIQTIVKTEYKEVKVPVVYSLKRPSRPVYKHSDNAASYLIKLMSYTKVLEVTIDEHNKKE